MQLLLLHGCTAKLTLLVSRRIESRPAGLGTMHVSATAHCLDYPTPTPTPAGQCKPSDPHFNLSCGCRSIEQMQMVGEARPTMAYVRPARSPSIDRSALKCLLPRTEVRVRTRTTQGPRRYGAAVLELDSTHCQPFSLVMCLHALLLVLISCTE